ncbi:MAG: maltose alpha-D-glucosyltransferase [Spirochaetes bacterium]|jgi:maltose alpha-D-glucosyltransferase/alpha-amylase|nr:maltose alpha-D-glucosyltransferase [Spirochaetota bacterium]
MDQQNPLWYKDAVIYELHVRSFADSDGNGMGDFKGLTERLDYLQDLGVNAIWLLPFYPSPWRDDGYDISDYTGIHEAYGNLRDFKRFLREAHRRDLRVITELVINHTSIQHPWFERARHAKPGTKYRDFYVWSDSPDLYSEARIIFQDFESSNWTWDSVAKAYYWHRFYSHQPDLNFESPAVRKELFRLTDFWFNLGVDGLRLDAVPYLYERENTNCENLPETHSFLKQMRAHIDEKFSDKMLLAEANQWPEDAVEYFGSGDECHMCFHFPLMPRLFMSVKTEDRFPVTDILEQTPDIPDSCQWGIFLRNHDELTLEMVTDEERDYMYRAYARDPSQRLNLGIRRRLAPLLENNRRLMELMNILLFSLPGTPVIYYGDEIGMGDNVYLGDRDGVRTPMQWSSDKNAGFSKANPQRLYLPVIIDPEYHYEALNIETQQANGSSFLWWMKRVIATRRRFRAFSRGNFEVVNSDNVHVFSFLRRYEDETVLVIANFSRHREVVTLELPEYADHVPEEVFSQNEFPRIREDGYTVNIGSNDFYWFILHPVATEAEKVGDVQSREIAISQNDWTDFSTKLSRALEQRVLHEYIQRSRWYREKSRKVRRIRVADVVPLDSGARRAWIMVVDIAFADEASESYVLPVSLALRDEAEQVAGDAPRAVIAWVKLGESSGVIYDAGYDAGFRDELLHLLLTRKKIKGRAGEIQLNRGRGLRSMAAGLERPYSSRVLKVEQSNTSFLYKDSLFFKLYRKLEDGVNPDVELIRYLTERRRFEHVPAYAGSLSYSGRGIDSASLGLMVSFVPNEGDAWSYTESVVERYFEHLLSMKQEIGATPPSLPDILDVKLGDVPEEFIGMTDGFFLELMHLLGRRTGELHLALSSERTDKDFAPENFSRLYQRSMYQSMRSLFRRVMTTVKKVRKNADEDVAADIDRLLDQEDAILAQFSRITKTRIHAKKIRIHGDYHLGQVLFTGRDFVIIDLEGEPARSLGERRLKYGAFRDVAGMIRSFHYAIYGKYLEYANVRPEDAEWLGKWIDPWFTYVTGVFLDGYLETVDGVDFVPEDPEELRVILEVFILEKAVYEIGYEINNRPAWLKIPVNGIQFVLDHLAGTDDAPG